MNGEAPSRLGLLSAGELFKRYSTDPLRFIIVVLTTVVLGYGARVDNLSPFTVRFLEALVGISFTGIEAVMLLIVVLEIIRRLVKRDFWLERSPVGLPMLWVGIVLGLIPYLRMIVNENRFRLPMELVESPTSIVLGFFVWLFVYKREDVQLMLWLVLIAGLFKSVEGIAIYLTVGLGWGLLTGWRDAMLMATVLLGIFFAFTIKAKGDRAYQNVRLFLFCVLPLAMFTYIGSTRRSFVLGAGAAIFILIFMFEKRERRRLFTIALPLVLVFGLGVTLLTGSSAFVDRLGVIGDPTKENSATYRLLEVYNISRMITEKPIFGWPMGVTWKNYTVLDFENVSEVVPHNTYLYVTWRGGAVGLILWIIFLVAVMRMHIRTVRAARTPFERFMAFWLAGATISMIVAGFTMPLGADRLKWFYPFLVVMAGYLPGAWPKREPKAVAAPAPAGLPGPAVPIEVP
jgi:O-antigen ligase